MIPQAGGFVSSETMVSAAILTGYTGTASNMLVKVNDYSAYLTGTNMMTGLWDRRTISLSKDHQRRSLIG